jgi:hypothetical protein
MVSIGKMTVTGLRSAPPGGDDFSFEFDTPEDV